MFWLVLEKMPLESNNGIILLESYINVLLLSGLTLAITSIRRKIAQEISVTLDLLLYSTLNWLLKSQIQQIVPVTSFGSFFSLNFSCFFDHNWLKLIHILKLRLLTKIWCSWLIILVSLWIAFKHSLDSASTYCYFVCLILSLFILLLSLFACSIAYFFIEFNYSYSGF